MRTCTLIATLLLSVVSPTVGCNDAAPSEASSTRPARARKLVPGDVHRYSFSWNVESTADKGLLGDVPMSGGLTLSGELELRVLAETGSGTTMGVRFANLDQSRIEIFGQDVMQDARALTGYEAIILVPADGQTRRVLFDPQAPSVFRHLMTGLMTHLDLRLPQGNAWRTVAPTGNGLAEVEYLAGDDQRTFTRNLERYLRVDAVKGLPTTTAWGGEASSTLVLDEDGMPRSIESEEILVLADREHPLAFDGHTRVTLTRRGVEMGEVGPPPDLTGWIEHDLHEPLDDTEAQREIARRFAEGLTMTDLTIAVQSAGRGLRPSPGFAVRARGLLRGWPELTPELIPLFEAAPDHRGRAFVLDLLVSADTPEAQDAIAHLLDRSPRAEDVSSLLQHLVLLRTPTPVTAKLLLDFHAASVAEDDDLLRQAVAYPMGTIASGIAATQPELSQLLLATLRDDLQAAETAEDRMAAIAGLGNAGFAEDLPRILAQVSDPDLDVRTDAINALRFFRDTRADAAIFGALDDPDRMVGAAALSVIEGYRLDDEAIERLARHVVEGTYHPELSGPIINVLAKRGIDLPEAREALRALSTRTDDARELRRIRRILGES